MTPLKLLLRVAQRLQTVLQTKAMQTRCEQRAAVDQSQVPQCAVHHACHAFAQAERRGLSFILPHLRQSVLGALKAQQRTLEHIRVVLEEPVPAVPDLRSFVEELRQLEQEFSELHIDWKQEFVSVTTEPITLNDVYLGPFEIRYFWPRLTSMAGVRCFDVVASDPHPAAANDRVTHPHVHRDQLCSGDATVPLQRAVEQGRLADAFCLINSVLSNYNDKSPHVALEGWVDGECYDCGCAIDEDDRYSCSHCDHDFCSGCSSNCHTCSTYRCLGCLSACAVCHANCCSNCLTASAQSERDCCSDCLQPCAACNADVAEDELTPDTRLCRECRNKLAPAPLPTVALSPSLENCHDRIVEPF